MAVEQHAAEATEHASAIHVVLKAEPIFSIGGFDITNALLLTWITMAVLVLFAYFFGKSLKVVPGKLQAGIEWAFEGVLSFMEETLGSRALAERFFPLIATIFLFVFIANELAFIPGVGSLMVGDVPLFRAPAADLNFTLALAIISFLTIEVTGILTLGLLKYGGKFVNLKSPVDFAVGIIELISNLGRLISFSFRLFGNIFAGEVMILVAIFFLPYVLPVPLMAFEVFVGLIQAVVFSMLTLFFIKLAIMEPHGEEAH
ncbi:MAG TPA: F0F1 ATP synthase subunit A [Candidatus Paceibacterota bacterium]|nr:F0F1 ATP synthase subunit A [Candidatus Paceibacterota bacterium]